MLLASSTPVSHTGENWGIGDVPKVSQVNTNWDFNPDEAPESMFLTSTQYCHLAFTQSTFPYSD